MKKIFSILLTTALLSGMLLPMAVSAEGTVTISATGTTVIEFEDYTFTAPANSTGTYAEVRTSNYSSNGKFLYFDAAGLTVKPTFTFPVTVEEAGTYTIVIAGTRTSTPKIIVGTGSETAHYTRIDTDVNNANVTVQAESTYNSTDNDYRGRDYFFEVALPAGATTLTVSAGISSGALKTCHDYISIRNTVAKVSADAVTTIEVEDYTKVARLGTDGSGIRTTVDGVTNFITASNLSSGSGPFPYAYNGTKRAFNATNVVVNTYPYNNAPNAIANVTKKLENGAFVDCTLDADEQNAAKASPSTNPLYAGYLTVNIPVAVQANGTYQLDIMCLNPYWPNGANASQIGIYRGTDLTDENLIGLVSKDTENEIVFENEKTASDNTAFAYMYRNSNLKGYLYAPISRYVFSTALNTTDTSITLVIYAMGKSQTSVASNSATINTQIDSITITGANVPNAISSSDKTGTVQYGTSERALGKAILALYNDDTLVAVEKWDATTGEPVMNLKTAYTGTFDEAKVFIWEDFENCLPKVAAKELTVN